jgi:DNA-binding response OmpR family regulator
LLAEMAALSERLEHAAHSTDRHVSAALVCAGATVRAARARLGCDLLLLDSADGWRDVPVVEVGGLRIDRPSRTVTRAGERIRLSRTLFDLLSLLATEPTRVYSKTEICRALWSSNRLPRGASRTIDSHVARLRGALGGPPWAPAHRGVGVSLLPPDIALAG